MVVSKNVSDSPGRRQSSTYPQQSLESRLLLDHIAIAALICDAVGRVHFENTAASAILQSCDGLLKCDGIILAHNRPEQEALRRLIAKAGRLDDPAGPRGMNISRPSGLLSYKIIATRSSHSNATACTSSLVILFIEDPEHRRKPSDRVLTQLYGITPAEARLVSYLLTGCTLNETAGLLAISRETARSTLKTVFYKTGTHSQGELICRLLTGPLALLPDEPGTKRPDAG